MIVRTQADGSLILVTQNDHAKLSGMFAAHWGNAEFAVPEPREAFIRAAAYHDCGWLTYETQPDYDPGTNSSPNFRQVPLDAQQLAAFQGGIDWIWSIDAYSGLLVSRHRTGLWRNRYNSVSYPAASSSARVLTSEVDDFVARNELKQEAALAAQDRSRFVINYQLLQILDLLSLYFCTADPVKTHLAHAPANYAGDGRDGVTLTLTPLDGRRIRISPNPFNCQELEVAFVYRQIPMSDLASQNDFRVAYFGAVPQVMNYTLV